MMILLTSLPGTLVPITARKVAPLPILTINRPACLVSLTISLVIVVTVSKHFSTSIIVMMKDIFRWVSGCNMKVTLLLDNGVLLFQFCTEYLNL